MFKSIPCVFAAWILTALLPTGCSRQPYEGPLFPAPAQGRVGFIDNRGRMQIPPQWENALNFSEGLAAVKREGRVGFIDNRGRMQIPPQWENALNFSEGLAAVKREGRWGFIDRQGKEVIAPRFKSVQPFHDGVAKVETGSADQPSGVIDKNGTLTLGPPTSSKTPSAPEPLTIQLHEGKVGYQDDQGKAVVEPLYNQGGKFREGLAPVQKEGHWYWINRSGEIMADFPAGIVFAEPLSDGLSLVTADRDSGDRGFGYVDRHGKWAVKPVWDEAEPFENGLARVGRWRENKVVYIDKTGEVIWREP